MRTTIEIKEEHRARLLEMAARRGERGFSGIIAEAIEVYLQGAVKDEEKRRNALALRGRLSARHAARLAQSAARFRKSWR